jgi:hypothetical protein
MLSSVMATRQEAEQPDTRASPLLLRVPRGCRQDLLLNELSPGPSAKEVVPGGHARGETTPKIVQGGGKPPPLLGQPVESCGGNGRGVE